MSGSYRLVPSKKSDIASLLENSYSCINPISKDCWKTSAANLREWPTNHISMILRDGPDAPKTNAQRLMDWASWEIARSALDESVKSSVGLLLYVDKIQELNNDDIRNLIPSFNTTYISDFAPSALYICHFHSVISGLAMVGFLARNTRYVTRVSSQSPRWRLTNASWQDDASPTSKRKAQTETFRQYDGIQGSQASWLPERSIELKALKKTREELTYRTERMGAYSSDDRLKSVIGVLPAHVTYQKKLLDLLTSLVKDGDWNRSYNPIPRIDALRQRFTEYETLASAVSY